MNFSTLQSLFDLFIAGLSLGGIYALLAFALSLALATTHVLNIAHGTFMVLSAALATLLIRELSWSWIPSIVAIVACFAALGALFEGVVVRPLAGKSQARILIGSILITFGLGIAIEALLGYYWANLVDPTPTFSLTFPWERVALFGVSLSASRLVILLVAAVTIVLLHLFMRRTLFGKAIRAMAENYEGTLILGINPRLVSRMIYVVCFALTAVAGILLILAVPLDPYSGLSLTLSALTIVVIGGVGSLPGALLGGCLLGLVEVATAYVFGAIWAPVVSVAVFFIVLLVRPQGVLGVVGR